MRIKLDENLPRDLVGVLERLGHDVETVHEEGLRGHDDPAIWRKAQSEGRFFVTQDMDFSDVRVYSPGTHSGLLLLRLDNPGWKALLERVRSLFEAEDAAGWSGCFVVATKHKVRVRRPAGRGHEG